MEIAFANMTADQQRAKAEELAVHLVASNVHYCVSGLVSTLAAREWDGSDGIDPDDLYRLAGREPDADDFRESDELYVTMSGKRVQAYDIEGGDENFRWTELEPIILDDEPAEKGQWCETELEAWQALFDDQRLEHPEGAEAYEHWLVSDWLAEQLGAAGESVARDVAGLTIWARCTSGQMIAADAVIERIARDLLAS